MGNKLTYCFFITIVFFFSACSSSSIIVEKEVSIRLDKSIVTNINKIIKEPASDQEILFLQQYLDITRAFELISTKNFSLAKKSTSVLLENANKYPKHIINLIIAAWYLAHQPDFIDTSKLLLELQQQKSFEQLVIGGLISDNLQEIQKLVQSVFVQLPSVNIATTNSIKKPLIAEVVPSNISPLAEMFFWVNKKKQKQAVAIAEQILSNNEHRCDFKYIYANFVMAQWFRKIQKRQMFFTYQQKLVELLNNSDCVFADAESINVSDFIIDADLWYARLLWERNDNILAKTYAEKAALLAKTSGNEDLSFEALQVLIGRIGYESFLPEQNLDILNKYTQQFPESSNLSDWIKTKQGLFLVQSQNYAEAATVFSDLYSKANSDNTKLFAAFWQWLSLFRFKGESDITLLNTIGEKGALEFYDVAAAAVIDQNSLHISNYIESVSLDVRESLKYFNINLEENFIPFNEDLKNLDKNQEIFNYTNDMRTAIIMASFLRLQSISDEAFKNLVMQKSTILSQLFAYQIKYLTKQNSLLFKKNKQVLPFSSALAWMNYISSDFANAIFIAGRIKDVNAFTNGNSFNYFYLYPTPYYEEYESASKVCKVDVNLLYAISRQESLFDASIESSASAIGLMQLLPSTAKRILSQFPEYSEVNSINLKNPHTNTLAGACYIAKLLERYKGNVMLAVAAYNAGEQAVDAWVAKRRPLIDPFMFIEFIPFTETQKYVQKVIRNYINMKSIYNSKDNNNFKKLIFYGKSGE